MPLVVHPWPANLWLAKFRIDTSCPACAQPEMRNTSIFTCNVSVTENSCISYLLWFSQILTFLSVNFTPPPCKSFYHRYSFLSTVVFKDNSIPIYHTACHHSNKSWNHMTMLLIALEIPSCGGKHAQKINFIASRFSKAPNCEWSEEVIVIRPTGIMSLNFVSLFNWNHI